jgi:hypothetical protein
MAATVTREALLELREKYAEMLAMRVAHDADEEDPAAVRGRMGALAARFPGALREIDELPIAEIGRRLIALDAVLGEARAPEPWMCALARFHALMRGALAAKRWLGGCRAVDAATVRAFEEALSSLPFPEDARVWAGELAHVAAPARGRVSHAVMVRVASELAISVAEARRLVFGAPRRRGSC